MPNPFANNRLLKPFILCPEGVIDADNSDPKLRICKTCFSSLSNNELPKLSLANDLSTGKVPKCLEDLTMVEESFCALATGRCCLIQLHSEKNDDSSPISQRGYRGHVIIYPRKPSSFANVLPPPMEDIITPMCVIFIGSTAPTKEWLLKKARPLVVRREVVRKALRACSDPVLTQSTSCLYLFGEIRCFTTMLRMWPDCGCHSCDRYWII